MIFSWYYNLRSRAAYECHQCHSYCSINTINILLKPGEMSTSPAHLTSVQLFSHLHGTSRLSMKRTICNAYYAYYACSKYTFSVFFSILPCPCQCTIRLKSLRKKINTPFSNSPLPPSFYLQFQKPLPIPEWESPKGVKRSIIVSTATTTSLFSSAGISMATLPGETSLPCVISKSKSITISKVLRKWKIL